MKKLLIILIAGFSTNVFALKTKVNPGITISNSVRGTVESGNWFSLGLQTEIAPEIGSQEFIAKTVAPIFDRTQTNVLIPANSLVKGKYVNNGDSCSFSIDSISFKNTQIDLLPGAYTNIDAVLPNLPECSTTANYMSGQLMVFQLKVAIPNLDIIKRFKPETFTKSADSYVQAVKTNDYSISNMSKYSNGFVQATIKVNDEWLDIKKLVPIYYDSYGIPHNLNYYCVPVAKGVYEYRFYSITDSFGFGVMEG